MKHLPSIGSEFEVTTTAMAHGAEAVARLNDGAVVFVSRGAPNERVRVRVSEVHSSFVKATVIQVIEPSPDRRPPPCRHAAVDCGGCPWQHLNDDAQAREKEALIRREAARVCPSATIAPIVRAVPSFGYRRRARFGYDSGRLGYRAHQTHRLFDVLECPVLDERLTAALPVFRTRLPPGSGNIDAMVTEDGRVHLGREASPFAQPSAHAERALVAAALQALGAAPARVVELFAGAGTFTVPLLDAGFAVDAYEVDAPSVARLRERAPTARVVRADLLKPGFVAQFGDADAVLLDPPRAGAAPTLESIAATGARVVVYVSCAPMTLFRDLRQLCEFGYRIDSIQPFDAFPQTFHVETVVRCVRD